MSKVLGLALGILAAIGGFVDIGDLVFNVAAGATFGYQLMWVIPIGVVGIIVYSEMCGRVAAVSGKAVFDAVRERVGFKAALGALVSSEVVNLMTLAAEIGGVAIALAAPLGAPVPLADRARRRRARGRDLGDVVRVARADRSATAGCACSSSRSRR